MIPLEGRAIAGLDEFMLRLGHLSEICRVAATHGGSAYRFERAVASRFSEVVPVSAPLLPSFARYLRVKGLCPTTTAAGKDDNARQNKEAEYRYPTLRVLDPAGPGETVISTDGDVLGQWQDVNLAHPGVPSKVGAISFGGKKGSKTGLSHLIDWGGFLGLFNSAGALTAFGQLVARYPDVAVSNDSNPYIMGAEKLIFAFLIAREDFDVFASLVHLLAKETGVLRKAESMRLYSEAVTSLADRAEKAPNLSQGRRQELFSLWKEIKPKRNDDQISSTAWHRVSARLENFIDLGLLRKEVSEQYEYKYRPTAAILKAKETLEASVSEEDWIDHHLVNVLIGSEASDEPIGTDRLEQLLVKLLSILSRPMSPLPLDVMSAGVAALSLQNDTPVTIGTARRSLERYAVAHPERARLSSGSTRKAEYISISATSLRDGRKG